MNFQIGDVVQMRSGGPLMTVTYIEDGTITCSWFNRDTGANFEVKWAGFPAAALKKAA